MNDFGFGHFPRKLLVQFSAPTLILGNFITSLFCLIPSIVIVAFTSAIIRLIAANLGN